MSKIDHYRDFGSAVHFAAIGLPRGTTAFESFDSFRAAWQPYLWWHRRYSLWPTGDRARL